MWIHIARFILRNRLPILIVLGLITVFMGYQASKIEMSYQYAPLLPEDDPVYQEYERFAGQFGNEGNLMVLGVRDSSFFEIGHFKRWQQLSDEIEKINGVTSVISASDSYQLVRDNENRRFRLEDIFQDPHDQKNLDSLKSVFKGMPFY
ncbi:MAG: RND family transporter, partial [Bacteroidota bacterium]